MKSTWLRWMGILTLSLFLGLSFTACEADDGEADAVDSDTSGGTASTATEVTLDDSKATPREVTIKIGGKVTWKNTTPGEFILDFDGSFQVTVPANGEASHTFESAGEFHYSETNMGQFQGKVIVQ